jgi:hypothetical protein
MREVVIVEAVRSPIGRRGGALARTLVRRPWVETYVKDGLR